MTMHKSRSGMVSMKWDADKLRDISHIGDSRVLGRVISRATRVGGRSAGVTASKEVRARFMKVKAAEVKRHVKPIHLSRGVQSRSEIRVDTSARWPLIRWQSGRFNHKKPPKVGARFRMIKGGKRFAVPGAFITVIGGREGGWARKGAARFPVRHLYTKAPLRYLGRREVAERVLDRGAEQMNKEFNRYSKYILSGGRKGIN